MRQAISLARRGSLKVCPNPMVGALVVKDSKVIAKAWHQEAGKAHAEALAIDKAGSQAKGADLYVSLEPCSHQGKTPPCTEKIIKAGIKKVFYAAKDPNPKAAGGEEILKNAGLEVISGTEESLAKSLNEVWFFNQQESKRPFVTLKLAVSSNNKISASKGEQTQISSHQSQKLVHKLRARSHAVMVGANTLRIDKPLLTNRLCSSPYTQNFQPIKVLLDAKLEIKRDIKSFTEGKVILITSNEAPNSEIKKAEGEGLRVIPVDYHQNRFDLKKLLLELKNLEIHSLLVEGGGELAKSLLYEKLVDKFYLFTSKNSLDGDGNNFDFEDILNHIPESYLVPSSKKQISSDKLEIFSSKNL